MTKNRVVNTKFWDDTYIADLAPLEKLIFLYLITSPLTKLTGVYELSLKRLALDTGVDLSEAKSAIQKFVEDEKVFYESGWVVMRNWMKHQKLNPSMQLHVDQELAKLPEKIREKIMVPTACVDGANSMRHIKVKGKVKGKVKVKVKVNTNLTVSEQHAPTPAQIMEKFLEDLTMQDQMISYFVSKGYPEQTLKAELTKFLLYWTEPTKNGKKQRWQTHDTFEVKRRFVTWMGNIRGTPDRASPPKAVRID